MFRPIGAAVLLLLLGVSHAAAPPMTGQPHANFALLFLHEIETPACGPDLPGFSTTPEVRPGLVYHRVRVQTPCWETVFVGRRTPTHKLQLVYRPVQVRCLEPVLVPLQQRVRKVRMVYRAVPCDRPHLFYVPHTHQEVRIRQFYRAVRREQPCTEDVYVAVVRRQKKVKLFYVVQPVEVKLTVGVVRMVDAKELDPETGKWVTVQKPVCEQRQVTETHNRVSLQPREVEETVTDYRLERRPAPRIVDYVAVSEAVRENVTSYHLQTRVERGITYVLQPQPVEETITHYRLEHRPATQTHYVPEWRAIREDMVTYELERRRVRSVERVIACPREIVVPVTRPQPPPLPTMRHVWQAQPAVLPCVTASGGGFIAASGPAHRLPTLHP